MFVCCLGISGGRLMMAMGRWTRDTCSFKASANGFCRLELWWYSSIDSLCLSNLNLGTDCEFENLSWNYRLFLPIHADLKKSVISMRHHSCPVNRHDIPCRREDKPMTFSDGTVRKERARFRFPPHFK